jgi:hypothetical protein
MTEQWDLVCAMQRGRVGGAESFGRRGFDRGRPGARDAKTRPYNWPWVEVSQDGIRSTSRSGACRPAVPPVKGEIWVFEAKRAGQIGGILYQMGF